MQAQSIGHWPLLTNALDKILNIFCRDLIWASKPVPQVACGEEDEDVATERLRVSTGAASTDVLQVNQLTKVYQHLNKKVHAVKKLSVGIPAGEVSLYT